MASFQNQQLHVINHLLPPCEVWPLDLPAPPCSYPLPWLRPLLQSSATLTVCPPRLSSAPVNPPDPRELPTHTLEVKPTCAVA